MLRRLRSCDFFLGLEYSATDFVVTLYCEGTDSLVALLYLVELNLVLFLNLFVLLDDRSGELNRRLNLLYDLFRLLSDYFLLLNLSLFLLFSLKFSELHCLSVLNFLISLSHFLKLKSEIKKCCSKAYD